MGFRISEYIKNSRLLITFYTTIKPALFISSLYYPRLEIKHYKE